MTQAHAHEPAPHDDRDTMGSRWKTMLIGLLAVTGVFLILEHRAHLAGVMPYLLALAAAFFCMFGHRHGGHRHEGGQR